MIRHVLAALALLALAFPLRAQSAEADVEALLAADRAFSAAAANAPSAAEGVIAMLDADAVMPSAAEGLLVGRETVAAALRASPAWREGRAGWSPVRGGISADGTQGFTFGYLTLTGGDPARRDRKYLAYWLRRPEGWRVVAYRQVVRPVGEVSLDMMPPSLPGFAAAPAAESAAIEAHRRSLAAAEQAFSDRARQVGLRAAFREYGREDAMNMSHGARFLLGPDAIAAGLPDDQPSPIHWRTERSFVASSGDLGVSIGTIRQNRPAEGQPSSAPFFTIWRRDGPARPWRYVAE